MTSSFKKNLILGSAVAVLASPAFAQAQNQSGENQVVRDEIVVTAQKREQTIVEIPQSVTVVGGEDLERIKATNFQEYLALVPGLQIDQDAPGQGRLILRGINAGGVASTVAVYMDETPFGSSTGLVNGGVVAGDFDTFDVARVEVLRGPQGTIYGSNSLGGVMKFVTNEPEFDEVSGKVRIGAESVKGGETGLSGAGVVNVPLSETVAFRASGSYRELGGYIDSPGTNGSDVEEDINGSEIYGGRASLLFEPNDALSVRLSAVLQDIKTDEGNTININATTLEPLSENLTLERFNDATNDLEYRVYNGTLEYDFGGALLTSSTSYSTFDQTIESDFMTFSLAGLVSAVLGTPPIELVLDQQTDQRKFTQEFRLTSDEDDRLEWQVGFYYTNEDGLIDQLVTADMRGTSNRETLIPDLAITNLDSEYEEIAGFGNATVYLSDRFDLTVGARYSHNSQSADQITDGLPGLFVGGREVLPTAESDEDVFTWSIAPRFDLSENASLYARVAKGFRPGGPNALLPSAPPSTPRTYDSDTTLSYEAGIKSRTSDGRFGFDASAFYTDWNDVQLLAVVNNFGVNTNGGGARILGAEATASFIPGNGLNLVVNAAYTDAELTTDTDPLAVGALDGDVLPFTPEFVLGVSADYEAAINDKVSGYLGGTLRYQTEQTGDFSPAGRTEFPDYASIDMRTGLQFDNYAVEIFVRNLTDVQGYTSGGTPSGNVPPNVVSAGIIRPRTVGLSLTADF